MRRKIAVLSLAVAAGTLVMGTPAEAYPVCAYAYTEPGYVPALDSGYTCMSYPFGVYCQYHHAWQRDAKVDVTVVFCIPAG